MKKQDINWQTLSFEYQKTDFRFVAHYEYQSGKWNSGKLIMEDEIHLHEGSGSLHYAQQCFESLKACSSKEGNILLFRPLENAKRMQAAAQRLMMPAVPTELFLKAVEETIQANYSWIPPYGTNAFLYIRPLLLGVGEMLGLTPAPDYEFRVFVSPVSPYFSLQKKANKLYLTQDYDRAAPQGVGSLKVGSNFTASFFIQQMAEKKNADDILFLDAKHQRYLNGTTTSNIIIFTKEKTLITPEAPSVFGGITKESLIKIAKEKFGFQVKKRDIDFWKEVENFAEVGVCGTSAGVQPVKEIITEKQSYFFDEQAPLLKQLKQELFAIQRGDIADNYQWIQKISP